MLDNVLLETLAIFDCDRALLIQEIDFASGKWDIPKMQFKKDYPRPDQSTMDTDDFKRFQLKASALFQDIIKVKNKVIIYSESKDNFDFEFFNHLSVKSAMTIAIFPKVGKPWIFSLHQCSYERVWSNDDILVFEQIMRRISDSISTFLYYKDLQESENKFRNIIETASEGVIILDKDRNMTFVNNSLAKMLGYEEKELLNSSVDNLVFEEDLEDHLQKVKSRQNLNSDIYDRRMKKKDGSFIWSTISAAPFVNKSREFVASFAMISDITERKKNEQEIMNLNRVYLTLVACNEALVQVNDEKELLNKICSIIVDKGGYRLVWVGYAIHDQEKSVDKVAFAGISKKYVEDIKVTWDDSQYGKGPTGTAIKTGKVFILNTISEKAFGPWKEQADKYGYESCASFPLIIDSNNLGAINIYSGVEHTFTTGELSLLKDLANNLSYGIKSIRLNNEIQQLNQNLERRVLERTNQLNRVNKELEAFSYSVSHDLRVPLNHIKGYLELLKDNGTISKLNEEEKLYFSKVSKLTLQMSQIIEGILSFSRIDYEQLILTSIDLNIMIKSVIQDFQPETKGRLVTWNIDNLPIIKVDENLFRLVIVNLLSNALKFTRKEPETKIIIGYIPTQSEYTFFIKDNGVGFDMKNIQKLFTVFERLHTNEEFEGTGIGLSNVKRIITRHGGKIWAESKLGEGATFYFSLPKEF